MRKGLTVSYKVEKLASIRQEIDSDEHYEKTPTSYYGEFDPINETINCINACVSCGGEGESHFKIPSIEQVPGAKNNGTMNSWRPRNLWYVECSKCNVKGLAVKKQWQAIMEWNKSPLSASPSYKTLPLFGLYNLAAKEALERLAGIRRDLELRISEMGLRGDLEKTSANSLPKDQMKAYLAWCIYAQSLVKQFKGQ